MLKKLQKDNKGFTIIEVMIVLAIAGLIILIVLLAVPALQRNGRNTAIKNDASAVAAGVTEFESNNDGAVPTGVTGTGTVNVSGATGTSATSAKVQGSTVVSTVPATGSAPAATAPATGTIVVYLGHKCETAAGAFTPGTTGAANTRAVAIYYSVENAGNQQQKCLNG
jgi:prepilin-type N-terminal cleavage/methylation domain-containing protein